ncbi:MAG TPA: copper resistance CopC family protein [Methylocystis sp.]|nr:copper resistance CopC family protein [Methylocystis sp.]
MTLSGFARAAACGAALWAASITAASAHGYLVQSFPNRKARLTESPHHISLLFSLRADANWSTVRLERDDGVVLAEKAQPTTSRSFRMETPKLAPGAYRVRYRMLTPDGDLMQGKVEFVVEQ